MIEEVYTPPKPYPTGFMWWFRNEDTWWAPEENNGKPYLPEVKNKYLRAFYWFCRNPVANFVGFVIGFEGRGFTIRGPAPVLATTPRDETPPRAGWKYAITNGWAPFISYWKPGFIEFYLGWRPSGGFGLKIVKG